MKKLVFILFFSLTHFTGWTQIANIFYDEFPDSAKARTGITADYDLNSNALTNDFITRFYYGYHIGEDSKNEVLKKVKNINRVGANINYGIYTAIKVDSIFHKKDLSFFINIKDRQHFDASFSKDLYKVGFYGNSSYAGTTADFNNFNVNLLRYQQIQVGVFSSKYDSAARWGIGVSFLNGEQYLSILAKKAELFTSEDGQYIDFNTSLQIAQSDTSGKRFGRFNGYGASIDIYFEAPFKTRIGDSKLKVSVSDIGSIRFNNQSLYLNQDSLFHYEGFTITSIYDLQDSTFGGLSQDSITARIAPFRKQSFSATLPATLNINFETRFNNYFVLAEGIRYVFNGNYSLLAYLKGNLYLNKNIMLSATCGYGGYGNFSYGLGIFAQLGKSFMIYAGSNNIEGYIAQHKTCGQGAYVSLIKKFN